MVKNSLRFILVITVAALINGAAIQAMELTKTETISMALASGTSDKEIIPRIPLIGASNTIKSNSENGVVVKSISTVSVKDFGAVGDGVTDDTLAIQKALNKGGTIVFPAGIYMVNIVTDGDGPFLSYY